MFKNYFYISVNFYLILNCVITSDVQDSKYVEAIQMTKLFGRPIGDKTSSLTAGYHGPVLLEDTQLEEDLAHFDRERIPERVAYAKGAGAFGVFQVTNPEIAKYTKAKLFESPGKKTKVAVRFSTFSGETGSADTVPGQPRGFAVKFYTEEGNWDLVGSNAPIYYIRDTELYPSLVHANKRNPASGLPDPTALWDFLSLRPETLNMVTYIFSDFGIPDGYRHMPGFSINAFKLVNKANEHVYAKFDWITNQGLKNLGADVAQKIRGALPDYGRQDLFNTIKAGKFPSWTLVLQVITEEQAKSFPFNPFDPTKEWPKGHYTQVEVGVMTLDKNPSNYYVENEQLAFNPAHLVKGIEPSPDKLLEGRLFHYGDAQKYRLGVNLNLIPVNEEKYKKVDLTERDGFMRVDGNYGSLPNYYPNSFTKDGHKNLNLTSGYAHKKTYQFDNTHDSDYKQARDRYNSYPPEWKGRLHKNIAVSLKGVKEFIVNRVLSQLGRVDHSFAAGVGYELQKINKILPKVVEKVGQY